MNIKENTRRVCVTGLMLAMIAAVSWLEHTLPQPLFLPPNFRLGLSNIIVMYCFFFMGRGSAALLNVLKALAVLLFRGPFAGAMSFCGGMAAILALLLLNLLFGAGLSYTAAGICGALAHNLGQLAAASVIVRTNIFLAYLPSLLIAGAVTGAVTGIMLKAAIPLLDKIRRL
ncbi:MAG: Gx transporter family protein [Oscillospiraceae bacterium]|nr:Gx transporter family protein [Oscillospiraceae bacterium]